jgi:mannose-1-phosphate guanylyltransferase
VWIVGERSLARQARRHLGPRSRVRLIFEPAPRNTAAALALGAATVRRRAGAEWVLCLPADQWIRKPRSFARVVRRVLAHGAQRSLVTFGLRPSYATPGYGYIEVGASAGAGLRVARRFVEKPPARAAQRYVRAGRWVWNSGMFLWRAGDFLSEVERLMPEVGRAVAGLVATEPGRRRAAARDWRALDPVSVDYGILEKARRVLVAPCDIGWQDLGSWDALAQVLPRAPDGTRHFGEYRSLHGGDCLIYAPQHLTVCLGARGIGLVVTPDAILLFDRAQHQRVREVASLLRRSPELAPYR